VTRRALSAVVALAVFGCGLGEVVTLGRTVPGSGGAAAGGSGGSGGSGLGGLGGAPPLLVATQATVVPGLSAEEKDDNPTLTADELLVCFTSLRPGGPGDYDVWCAERTARDQAFSAPVPIDPVNSEGFESSPALELDGLTLWFGSERDDNIGGSDIFRVTRGSRTEAWGAVARVDELCSAQDDIPRPPAMGSTVMPLGSRRGDDVSYWTYLAERSDPGAAFEAPRLVEELATPDYNVVDAFLSEDGLLLLFTYDLREDDEENEEYEDIYSAVRPDLQSPFGEPIEVGGINTDSNERDPWLSPDRRRIYFSSDRSGQFEIYVAEVE
jgi:hypothetical protein